MPKAKVRERKGSEDRTRVREKELGLGGAKGDVFNAVYYVQGILYTVGSVLKSSLVWSFCLFLA